MPGRPQPAFPAARPPGQPLPAPVEQQLELLHRAVDDNARALAEARAAAARLSLGDLELASELASREAAAIARLREARYALREQTEAIARLTQSLPPG